MTAGQSAREQAKAVAQAERRPCLWRTAPLRRHMWLATLCKCWTIYRHSEQTTLQQHLRRQIIRGSRSACVGMTFLLPFATPSWQWTLFANISKLFCLLIHEVVAHSWLIHIIAPFINVLTYLRVFRRLQKIVERDGADVKWSIVRSRHWDEIGQRRPKKLGGRQSIAEYDGQSVMMMTLRYDDFEPWGLRTRELVIHKVWWWCPVQTFEHQNSELVPDSLRSLQDQDFNRHHQAMVIH